MPAAAVIPAPIAYIKVVAVKKLVVGFLSVLRAVPLGEFGIHFPYFPLVFELLSWHLSWRASRLLTEFGW